MRRFYIEKIIEKDGHVVISGPEARHISRVLRMGRGDHIIIMDKKGRRFEAAIQSVDNRELRVRIVGSAPQPLPSPVKIDVCQALLRSRPMDYLIEKTSELGIHRITPFFSERTIIRMDKSRAEGKIRHWREISHSAAKQADRFKPAEIADPVSFKALMDRWEKETVLKIILWEREGSIDLKNFLRSNPPEDSLVGMIGPEGGFSDHEVMSAEKAGFVSVSMGRRLLRAETASITFVAVVQYEWGDLSLGG
ncbi:MAG: 16S rRNA (uracil(1498)-N(3))-methyltransferase [Deltaproteobacteria bacterium]|nr:16S rRNA (uracil(1498)-N(3))-methyltransferase [Deltaproteobacteria bacterium]